MTVGKIYVGLIIAENWRAYKASQSKMNNLKMVSLSSKPNHYNGLVCLISKLQDSWSYKQMSIVS